jgi:hypothetical protein
MYKSFELMNEALNHNSWCYDVFYLYMVNGMLIVGLFSLFMHLFQCCVYV